MFSLGSLGGEYSTVSFFGFDSGVGVLMGSGVGVDAGEGVGAGVAVGKADCLAGLIVFPLFQTSFLPDLTHLNCFPLTILVMPILLHSAPAFGGVAENAGKFVKTKESAKTSAKAEAPFFMRARIFLNQGVTSGFIPGNPINYSTPISFLGT
jgi:hypothetical protein